MGEEEVSLTFRHVLGRLRVPGLNKPLHFLAFQRQRRFSLPQVSRRVVGKDSNPLSSSSSSSSSSSASSVFLLRILPTVSVLSLFLLRSFFFISLHLPFLFSSSSVLSSSSPVPFPRSSTSRHPASFPVAVTVVCFPCIPGVVAFHRWRRVNIRDSGARRIHSKLADLDRRRAR